MESTSPDCPPPIPKSVAPQWRKATVHTSANVAANINQGLPQRPPVAITPKAPSWQAVGAKNQGHRLMEINQGEWKPPSYTVPEKPPVFGVPKRKSVFPRLTRVTRATVAHAVAHNVAATQRCVRNYWVLSALTLFALLGAGLALLLFLLPCDPIYVPVTSTVNRTVNRTFTELETRPRNVTVNVLVNVTRNVTTNRTFLREVNETQNITQNRTVNRTVQILVNTTSTEISVVPFDGMLLLDASGSIASPAVCNVSCRFDDQTTLGILVGEALYNGTIGKGGDHFQVGTAFWNFGVVSSVAISGQFRQWQDVMNTYMGKTFTGGTRFGPPLARCWQQVKQGPGVNNDPNTFKMCMLFSDGINQDKIGSTQSNSCTTAECLAVCNPYGYSGQCNAETVAWSLKKNFNITLPAAYVAVTDTGYSENANNMYCYSSCNMEYEKVDDCKAAVFAGTDDAGDAATREQCKYFVDGDFSRMDELRQKLLNLANGLVSNNTVIDTTIDFDTVEAIEEVIVQSVVQVTRPVVQAITEEQTDLITDSVLEERMVQENVTSAREVVEPVAITEEVQTGVVEDGCKDPDYFWLMLFFVPLIAYLLYFPIKLRRELIKARVRDRLAKKRAAMHEALEARRERAQAVRDRLEALRNAAEAKEIREGKLAELEAAQLEKNEIAAKLAEEHAAKEAAKEEIHNKVAEVESKLDDQKAEVEAMQAQADAKKPKISASAPPVEVIEEKPEEPSSPSSPKPKTALKKGKSGSKPKKKIFRWNIAANDQYIWAGGGGGAAPQNVDWGKHGKPTENDKAKVVNARESKKKGNSLWNPDGLFRKSRMSAVSRKSIEVIEEENENEDVQLKDAGKKSRKSFMSRASTFRSRASRISRRLEEQIRVQDELEFEKTEAMLELQALEDEILAARNAANMSAEAAARALEEIERLRQEQEEEEELYQNELAKEIHMEEEGELEDDGDFWLDVCACCCWVNTAEADAAHPHPHAEDLEHGHHGNNERRSLAMSMDRE